MEEYIIPEHLLLLRDKSIAANELLKIYVKMPFCYKRALKASTNEATFMRLFWSEICKLYPDLSGRPLQIDIEKKIVIPTDGADNKQINAD